jgi:diguanylate cyclase (GGDEF)-like protein/PAS domain S-box-containing protein
VESPSALLGKTAFDLFPQGQAAAAQVDDLQVTRAGGTIVEHERSTVDDQGNAKWALTTKVPLIDDAGGVVGIVGVHRDITRSKQVEQKLRQSEANLAAAQRIAHFGSFEQDLANLEDMEHRPLRCSEEVFRILGLEPRSGELPRADFFQMVHPEDPDRIREVTSGTIHGSKPHSVDYRIVRSDQTERIVQGTGDVVYDAQTHKPLKLVGTIQDITDRKRAETQVEEANQRLAERVQELQRRSTEISLLSDMGGWLQSCQTADEAYAIIGKSAERLFQEWSGALYVISPSRNAVETVTDWGPPIRGERVFAPDDCWALRRGRPHWFEIGGAAANCHHTDPAQVTGSLCVPLMAQGEAIGILNLQRAHSDERQSTGSKPSSEAEQKLAAVLAEQIALALGNLRLRETLRNQSIRDPLTGLFNRRYLEESLEREISRATRNKNSVAIIMMDLDRFKVFNDTFGHQAGDAALRTFGDFLKKTTRGQDIACRYGGEEFAMVLSDCHLDGALQRAEALREGVKQLTVQHAGQLLGTISLSMGLALFPDHGSTISEVVRAADQALYCAKRDGRDRVCAWSAQSVG